MASIDEKKILSEPFGVVKTATIRTFILCAEFLLKGGNKPTLLKGFDKSGVSHFMASQFLDFGCAFGLVEVMQPEGRRQLTYKLSEIGAEFYKSLAEWEKRLRKK